MGASIMQFTATLRKLRSRLNLRNRFKGRFLNAAEALLPSYYYVQLRPRYANGQWETDRRRYDQMHDWDNFRDGNRGYKPTFY